MKMVLKVEATFKLKVAMMTNIVVILEPDILMMVVKMLYHPTQTALMPLILV